MQEPNKPDEIIVLGLEPTQHPVPPPQPPQPRLPDLRPPPPRAPRRLPPPAGFGTRLQALLLDAVLMLALSMPLMWMVYGQPIARLDDLRPLSLAINWLLPGLLAVALWTWQGATPGKLFMGVRVVDALSGQRPSLVQALLRWLGYWLSALPLGLGFLWALWDPEGRAWHDRLSGTRVLRRQRRDGSSARDADGYLIRHWRGQLSLVQAFWINNILLALPLGAALGALMSWISLKGEALQAGSIAVLLAWPVLIVVQVWCIVGAWRAASRYLREGGHALWTWLTRLVLLISAAQILVSALAGFGPQMDEYWQLARGRDPIGQAQISLSDDGRTLRLNGPIGMGDATRVQTLLAGRREPLRLVELQSPGGRVHEAERMVQLVRQAGADTRVVGGCESACTLVFLAGDKRQLMPGAQLGFHRASSNTFNPVFDEMANRELAATYRRMGLPEGFIERTLRTPAHSMWYPRHEELLRESLIQAPPQTLSVSLPQGAEATLARAHAEALRSHPSWHQLEQRFPGLLDEAGAAMLAARQTPAASPELAEEAAQQAALRSLAPRLPELITGLPPEPRRRYLQLLRAQLRASLEQQGSERCRARLAGDLSLHRLLPETLQARESSWLASAAQAEPPRWLPRPPSAVELEVVRRSLGGQAPGLLAGLWRPGAGNGSSCEQALRLIDASATLPVAQRELAERLLFQGRLL
ncbi:RDD family protein [Roseateles sp.]|uniref:RDD family protein n=1 Tax=Roseateles sp. TaxID=1971397 RepID=UPI00391AAA2C